MNSKTITRQPGTSFKQGLQVLQCLRKYTAAAAFTYQVILRCLRILGFSSVFIQNILIDPLSNSGGIIVNFIFIFGFAGRLVHPAIFLLLFRLTTAASFVSFSYGRYKWSNRHNSDDWNVKGLQALICIAHLTVNDLHGTPPPHKLDKVQRPLIYHFFQYSLTLISHQWLPMILG